MSTTWKLSHLSRPQRWLAAAVLAAALLTAALVAVAVNRRARGEAARQPLHTVQRGDLLISVTEGGTLEAVKEVKVLSEIYGQVRIISIVPEGTTVKKGDLLVELDDADLRTRLSQEEISFQSSLASYQQAKENVEICRSLNATKIREAELNLQSAKTELEKYRDAQWPIDQQTARSSITLAEADLSQSKDRLNWTQQLQQRGYATRSELEGDQLAVTRKVLDVEQAKDKLRLAEKYEYPQRRGQLEADVEKKTQELERVKRQASADLSAAEADSGAKEVAKSNRETSVKNLKQQLAKAKLSAPQDGLVVYPRNQWNSQTEIEAGAMVRERQELITLPDLAAMRVVIKVHESTLSQIRVGQAAYVSLDAYPDQRFRAKVTRVAVMPDQQNRWMNPNLKVYSTDLLVEDPLPAGTKPGLSAKGEILIGKLEGVLSVPIQAVTTVGGKPLCFRRQGLSLEPVPVTVGQFNDASIEIVTGLAAGDRIALTPPNPSELEQLGLGLVKPGEVKPADLPALPAKAKPADPAASREPAAPPGGTAAAARPAAGPPAAKAGEPRPALSEAERQALRDRRRAERPDGAAGNRPDGGRGAPADRPGRRPAGGDAAE